MKYSKHRILEDGHIEVRQVKDGAYHRRVIAPNQPIDGEPQDVQEAILADPDYKKYRTATAAAAYEKRLLQAE